MARDYAREYALSKKRGEQGTGHDSGGAARMRNRREAMKLGMVRKGDGKDIDHRIPLSKGGAENAKSNWRIESEHKNRSFPRRPDGSMIANHPKGK
jgi:hypothetical protein